VLASFISPYRAVRYVARQECTNFIDVFVDAPLEVCIERDTKGMYKRAIAGEIPEFTGISDPYERPDNAELLIPTHQESPDESTARVLRYLEEQGFIAA
jgi:adenylylsulfate kinase-like enzyme